MTDWTELRAAAEAGIANDLEDAQVLALLDERDALVKDLLFQWESNHIEHCSREWPHPTGRCYWPPPESLPNPPRGP